MSKKSCIVSVCCVVMALGACFLVSSRSFAQSQAATATLTGRITDQSGAAIAGVNIELLETETGARRVSVSDSVGLYNITNLSHGTYKLTAKISGFSDVIISPIALEVGQTANVAVVMEPGKLTQHVEVVASALQLQSQTSELSAVLSLQHVMQLPSVARNPMEFIAVMPGVTGNFVTGQGKGGNQSPGSNNSLSDSGRSSFEAGGLPGQSAEIMVDGISINAQSTNMAETPKILPSTDVTAEFSLVTNNLSPEYGRAVSVVNIVTKHGTNALHGSLYEYVQNTAFNANNFINNSRGIATTVFNKNQFGGTVGGPVYIPHLYNGKDRTWFFANLEQLRSVTGGATLVTVPTAAEKNGDFSGLLTTSGLPITIYDPTNTYVDANGVVQRQPFQGNIIPSGRLNSFAQKVMSYYPNPNVPGGQVASNGAQTNINNFDETTSTILHFTRILIRGDHQIGTNQQVMARFEEDPELNPYDSVYGTIGSPLSSSLGRHTHFHNAEISHAWTVSPTFVVQQSVGWANEQFVGPNFSPGFDPGSLGGPFASGQIQAWAKTYGGGPAFPDISVNGYGGFGESGLGFYSGDVGNGVYNLNLTKEKGRHELKWGFQFQYDPQFQVNGLGTSGDYTFNGQFTQGTNPLIPTARTGDGIADFLLGYPASGGLSSQQRFTSNSSYYAWYFLDNFKITRRLTLNLGMRYEFTKDFTDRFNQTGGINPFIANPIGNAIGPNTNGQTLNQFLGRTIYGGLVFAGTPDVGGRRTLIPNDYGDVGPRLGFAYQVDNKTVVRGGISRIYAQSLATAANSGAQNTGVFNVTTPIVGTIDGIHPNVTINNPLPGGILVPLGAVNGLLTDVGLAIPSGEIAPLVTPYVNEWNLGIQRAVTGNSVLSVAYAASRGRRLACPSYCGDQLSQKTLAQYGSSLLSSVPNPFYGIITNTASALSRPTVQQEQLLKFFPQFTGGSLGTVPSIQGQNSWPIFDETNRQYPFISNWNALEVSYELHSFHGVQLMVAYTLSKKVTDASGLVSYGLSGAGFQDIHNPLSQMAISPTDVPQRLVISHVADLPFGRGKSFASNVDPIIDRVIGGWQLSGILTLASGFPVPINQTPNTLNALVGDQRPNMLANAASSSGTRGQRISQWFANPTSTFAAAAPFTYGNAPQVLSSVRSDPLKDYDVSLIKFIPITEKLKAEFRASAFNAFNRPWFGLPTSTYGSSTFGLVSQLNGPPRGIELSLRLNW